MSSKKEPVLLVLLLHFNLNALKLIVDERDNRLIQATIC